jgi:hypothetical protein
MIDAFADLDHHIPRGVCSELISWQDQGFITVDRLYLPDTPPDTPVPSGPDPAWIDLLLLPLMGSLSGKVSP